MKNKRYEGPEAVSYLFNQPGMTKEVAIILERKLKNLKDIHRDKPPVKGAFINYLKDKGQDRLLSWTLHVKERVLKELEKLSSNNPGYQSLLDMEKFQFNQKGPMSPIESRVVLDSVIPKLVAESEKTPDESAKQRLLAKVSTTEKRYRQYMSFASRKLTDIDFEIAWTELPSASLRGLPFLRPGSEVDGLITRIYGRSLKSVLNQFRKLTSLITTPGLRIQGSPRWDQAKVRLINIPAVNYQYLMNGLYKVIKDELIKVPSMAGWLTPDLRDEEIVKMCAKAKERGLVPIPLDFRSFDARMFPSFRLAISELLLMTFSDSPQLREIRERLGELYSNQFLCGPSVQSNITFYPVNNLLGSGVANTQADGSTLNMTLQCYLCDALDYEQPIDLGLTLGDDAVIWVPQTVVEEYSYEGLLEFWQKQLDPLNMEIHVKKKYPNPQVLFLQRLYVPEQGIIGEYSLVRNIDSLVWAERFRTPIEGVINHMALETIGQISTLNNSMQGRGDVTFKSLIHIVVEEWLKVDKALCHLAQLSAKTKDPSGSLFGYLVKASGGLEAIVRAYKLEQYDHKGLLELFSSESAESFPLIDVIVKVSLELPVVRVSLEDVYGLADEQIGSLRSISENVLNEMIDDM